MSTDPGQAVLPDPSHRALLTDLYQLTMLRAYHAEGMDGAATFSLYYRTLPEHRNYLLAAGLDDALAYLETVRFPPEALEQLAEVPGLDDPGFLDWLGGLRFTGDVRALPEGTPVFPDEPLLEVTAPIAEAQLAETYLMNQVHHQTVVASKAARIVEAARGRAVVDFGLRRMHGIDAGVKGARAFHVAGTSATSNVLASRLYGIPVTGTMAHAYIQAHDDEMEAFRAFTEVHPGTVLLIDTYDTLEGARKVVELARERGEAFEVRGVRLDSGDLVALARQVRAILDEGGLERVEIFASGGLDEWRIRELADAPIDGFGVGTRMGVARDAPALDMAYKLVEYGGRGRLKLSSGKSILPGPKQVYRLERNGEAVGDVLARADEEVPGRPLLVTVMEGGERVPSDAADLEASRERARREIARLPDRVRALEAADPPYPVEVGPGLRRHRDDVVERVEDEVA